MSESVTKDKATVIDLGAFEERGAAAVDVDIFKTAKWRKQILRPDKNGRVTVRLSTGKTVTTDSRMLAFLRILADELAKEEDILH